MSGILLSFAHPDDESVFAAGIACKYGAAGAPVVLSVATRGEAGKVGDPPVCTREELAVVREAELRRAGEVLGLTEIAVLGYGDRDVSAAPPDAVRRQLVHLLRRHRPDIVVTFDPNGSNLHPDHVAISRFTSDAIAAAGDASWVPEAGEPHRVRRLLWTPPQRPWQMMRTPGFPLLLGIDFLVDITPWRARKAEALCAHHTQHLTMQRVFFGQPDVERLLSMELFQQAWGPALVERPAADIFVGL